MIALPQLQTAPDPRTVSAVDFNDFGNLSENPWSNSTSNSGKRKTYGDAIKSQPTSPRPSTTQPKQIAKAKWSPSVNPTSWIVRFPTAIPEDQRYPESIVVEMVNSLTKENKQAFRFQCVTARWTHAGNLSITFSAASKDKDIESAKVSILTKAAHGRNDATISQNVPWSTVVVHNVPCRKVELVNGVPETSAVDGDYFWSSDQIVEQLRMNSMLKNATFPKPPNWAKGTLDTGGKG